VNRFDRILSESHMPLHLRLDWQAWGDTKCVVGEPGVRDTLHPCEFFQYGPATGDCESDGHYMCKECKCLTPLKASSDLEYL
jgi:hypothetical protein